MKKIIVFFIIVLITGIRVDAAVLWETDDFDNDVRWSEIDNVKMENDRLANGYKWANAPRTIYVRNELNSLWGYLCSISKWNTVKDLQGHSIITLCPTSSSDAEITIRFGSNIETEGRVAKTFFHTDSTGYLDYVTIVLNQSKKFTDGEVSGHYDYQSVIQHELGHALGVAHCHEGLANCTSPTCQSNVMNNSLPTNYTRTNFTNYDIASYRLIYIQ